MRSPISHRPTWIEINLDHLANNYRAIKAFVGTDVLFMAIVKADAYGHSAIECAAELEKTGVDWFGVAIVEEGIQLRRAGIRKPILCLGGVWEGQERLVAEFTLTPVVFDISQCLRLDRFAASRGLVIDVHLKLDTGMGRLGVPYERLADFLNSLKRLSSIRVDGLMTHFAAADDLNEVDYTSTQIARFDEALAILERNGFHPTFTDLANSPGAIVHPKAVNKMVRIGGLLYGLGDDILPEAVERPDLKPVLSLFSRVSYLKNVPKGESLGYGRSFRTDRDSLVATVPIGYHDGYPRNLSNKGKVLIRGQIAPVVGRVSMDWIIVDVTDIPEVLLDDLVTIIGTDSHLTISAADLAKPAGTIAYEITCGLNSRIARKYVRNT